MLADPPLPTHDPEQVRRVADAVLASDEFAEPDRSVILRALDWIVRQLERLFGGGDRVDLDPAGGGGAGGSSLFTVLVLVAAMAAGVVLVRSLRGTWRRRARATTPEIDVDVDAPRSPAAWDDLARRLEAEGRWKEAVRARFGALVAGLAEAGVVADIPGRTTGEYRAEVRGALPEVADAFADAADVFDRAWYGDLPTGAGDAARLAAGAERVLTAAGGRS